MLVLQGVVFALQVVILAGQFLVLSFDVFEFGVHLIIVLKSLADVHIHTGRVDASVSLRNAF